MSHQFTDPEESEAGHFTDHQSSAQPYPQPATRYDYSAPFADAAPTMPSVRKGNPALWAILGVVGTLAVLGIGYVIFQSVQDPYRTLDVFPTEKYLSDYQGVVGSRFRANLIVDAELGGSFEKGRILTFREETSSKSLAVLVPPDLAQTGFSKGQNYTAELEVGPGGLIQAYGFKKN
ncbi:MAG: hypothetical protein KA250_10420 [Verrucomicrobiales bacterium]|jgi:hypothetical protein|nr:hypothetical protein [Verrucomicrobiales bacterium]MBP9224285.1 hypothetical protein [Verrucomicrobiales bacterium]HQZ27440.1 hypothetical protein [Verrucomicrobiales bacterium]